MPGYMTHYIFGELEYHNIENANIKCIVKNNKNVYHLGLQGPDLFFYYPGAFLISKKNLGSLMHNELTGMYIKKMLSFVINIKDREKKEIATAYLVGFLGHYCMDIECHPYIYYKTDVMHKNKLYKGKHIALETDIDYLLAQKYLKKKSSDYHYGKLISITNGQCEVVAKMLTYACKGTYKGINLDEKRTKQVIKNMSYIINLINDKSGRIKGILRYISNIADSITNIEPLFISDQYQLVYHDPLNLENSCWYNPWENDEISNTFNGRIRNDNFINLMNQASFMYHDLITKMIESINQKDGDNFIGCIGNRSLISGLEI